MYNETVRSVRLYGCHVKDGWPVSVFDHVYVRNIARVSWEQRVCNDGVHLPGLNAYTRALAEIIVQHCLRWPVYVLHMNA